MVASPDHYIAVKMNRDMATSLFWFPPIYGREYECHFFGGECIEARWLEHISVYVARGSKIILFSVKRFFVLPQCMLEYVLVLSGERNT